MPFDQRESKEIEELRQCPEVDCVCLGECGCLLLLTRLQDPPGASGTHPYHLTATGSVPLSVLFD